MTQTRAVLIAASTVVLLALPAAMCFMAYHTYSERRRWRVESLEAARRIKEEERRRQALEQKARRARLQKHFSIEDGEDDDSHGGKEHSDWSSRREDREDAHRGHEWSS